MNVFQRIGVGLKAWYWAWFVEGAAERLAPTVKNLGLPAIEVKGERLEAKPEKALPPPEKPAAPPKPAPPPKPARSEALTLLETLQREARLIDFLKEDIAAYQDAQVGAAVRDVHRDAAKVLERLFALRAVLDQTEGSPVTVGGSDAGRVRFVGNVREGATSGTLVHHGWVATKVELPVWSGPKEAERVVAPAEVEVA
ncbi:MAG TPA: DUF2760 domain-containing protein [Planctomycetaceae bacterium]